MIAKFGEVVTEIAEICGGLIEIIGMVILCIAIVKGVIAYIKRDPETENIVGEGISMALTFLMGGEVMHTIADPTLMEVGVIGAIIACRVALSATIAWERGVREKERHANKE